MGLGLVLVCSGCVSRLIRDLDGGGADGDGTGLDTDSDGIGETDQISTGEDPDAECNSPDDCGAGQTCFEGVCVGMGTLRISLSWSAVTDLDLHLLVPNGDRISFQNQVTPYGELDVDDCVAGECVNPDGVHVENIFLESNAPRGEYQVKVVNFDGAATAQYDIEVAGAVDAEFSGTVPNQSASESPVYTINW